jgi:hypothetical protein
MTTVVTTDRALPEPDPADAPVLPEPGPWGAPDPGTAAALHTAVPAPTPEPGLDELAVVERVDDGAGPTAGAAHVAVPISTLPVAPRPPALPTPYLPSRWLSAWPALPLLAVPWPAPDALPGTDGPPLGEDTARDSAAMTIGAAPPAAMTIGAAPPAAYLIPAWPVVPVWTPSGWLLPVPAEAPWTDGEPVPGRALDGAIDGAIDGAEDAVGPVAEAGTVDWLAPVDGVDVFEVMLTQAFGPPAPHDLADAPGVGGANADVALDAPDDVPVDVVAAEADLDDAPPEEDAPLADDDPWASASGRPVAVAVAEEPRWRDRLPWAIVLIVALVAASCGALFLR